MLKYVLNKLWSNKWMTVCLLIGNILLISIAAVSPMYSDAALQRMLTRQLTDQMEETDRYPSTVEFRGNYVSYGTGKVPFENLSALEQTADDFASAFPVPLVSRSTEYYMTDVSTIAGKAEVKAGTVKINGTQSLRVDSVSDFEDHVTILSGQLPSETVTDNTVEAVVSDQTMSACSLYIGEILTMNTVLDQDHQPYYLKIVGVFEAKESSDPYWFFNPNTADHHLFVDQKAFLSQWVDDEDQRQTFQTAFYVTPDYTKIRGSQADRILELTKTYQDKVNDLYNKGFSARYQDTLSAYSKSAGRLNTTLAVLEVPIFLLLAAFIIMVSSQMIRMDQSEIAILKSRGAFRRQILLIYLTQSLIIVLISLVISMPLSYWICQVIGSANAFLEFVSRKALPARFTARVFGFALAAALLSVLAMVIPAFRYSKVGIVDMKRSMQISKKPLWQKLYLDLVLLAVSGYGLYSYYRSDSLIQKSMAQGAQLDPLLYICSSLFMLGMAMLFVRLFPWLIRLVYTLFKRILSPGQYASFLGMLRDRGSRAFIMIFMVLTLSLGIFSAQSARTINSNAEEQIRYQNGADLVVKEKWTGRQYQDPDGSVRTLYSEPDYTKYQVLLESGAQSMTKVYRADSMKATLSGSAGTVSNTSLMGINTKEFGQTAYLKDGLLDSHWYNFLNAMSRKPEAVLVSTDFRDQLGAKIGDRISYQSTGFDMVTGQIVGFVDYWPGMMPPEAAVQQASQETSAAGTGGGTAAGASSAGSSTSDTGHSYFIIANLSYLNSRWGTLPYQIWIKNSQPSSQYIYDFASQNDLTFVTFTDTNADIIDLKNDPVFQATNGILTVGFIVVLVLAAAGFLIYWILSIRSRQLQFGIFRAMGMSMREVLGMLASEQFWISILSIAAGVGVGKLTGRLFVPLIMSTYAGSSTLIPLTVAAAASDEVRLLIVVALVMILLMLVLARIIRRIRIAQALKLGEE